MTGMILALLAAHAPGGWTEFPRKDAPPALIEETTYYVGSRLIVVGRGAHGIEGSIFDFDRGRWTPMRPLDVEQIQAPAFLPRLPRAQVLGDELLFFFGQVPAEPSRRERPFTTGARYDFKRNVWRPMQREGALPAAGASLVRWEKARLMVFRAPVEDEPVPQGGVGAIYDATADRWTAIASDGAPRTPPTGTRWAGTYAGHRLLLFGRSLDIRFLTPKTWAPGTQPHATGAEPGFLDVSYDLDKKIWRRLPLGAPRDASIPIARSEGGRALVLGGGEDTRGLEGGEYDPVLDQWIAVPNSPLALRGRYLWTLDGLVGHELCAEGREESISYQLFHLDSHRWSQTRQRTHQCGNVIVHDEDALLILETVMSRNGWIPLHVYSPAKDAWRHGEVPAAGGPSTLGAFGLQLPEMFPDHVHWDGRRIVVWGGTNVVKDRPDPCGAKPGPNPACAPSTEPNRVAHTGYWTIPRWR